MNFSFSPENRSHFRTVALFALVAILFACNKPAGNTPAVVADTIQDPGIHELAPHRNGDSLILALASRHPEFDKALKAYDLALADSGKFRRESEVMEVFRLRDSVIKAGAGLTDELNEELLWQSFDALNTAFERRGITLITVEGFLVDFGPAPVLQSAIRRTASQPLMAYDRFLYAESRAQGGEYPFTDLGPTLTMVLEGEKLKNLPPNAYFPRVETAFRDALQRFVDFHYVISSGAESEPRLIGVSTETYPYLAETGTYRRFISQPSRSPYHKVVREMFTNPSEIHIEKDTVYVVQAGEIMEENAARTQLFAYLDKGISVVHNLVVTQPDGEPGYVLAYRFFWTKARARAALTEALKSVPEARLVPYLVRDQALYPVRN